MDNLSQYIEKPPKPDTKKEKEDSVILLKVEVIDILKTLGGMKRKIQTWLK